MLLTRVQCDSAEAHVAWIEVATNWIVIGVDRFHVMAIGRCFDEVSYLRPISVR